MREILKPHPPWSGFLQGFPQPHAYPDGDSIEQQDTLLNISARTAH
jgi:hypothetical protein